jgi:cytochrome c oxidase subunit 4
MSEHKHFIVPYRTFVIVWALLGMLTGLTVVASRIDLGHLNVWVALGIAATKSALVISFFMNIRQESHLFRIGLVVMLSILAIFIGLTFVDTLYR